MESINNKIGKKSLAFSLLFSYAMAGDTLKYIPVIVDFSGLMACVPVQNITLQGNSTVHLTAGKPYIDEGVSIIDNDNDNIDSITKTGEVNIYKVGTYTIKYIVKIKDGQTTKLERKVVVDPVTDILPDDTNTFYAKGEDKNNLYFADPQPSENGKNRVIKINYSTMNFDESKDSIQLTAEDSCLIPGQTYSNPHSVDRAGKTNRLYVRTQNAYSFDVIASENNKLVYKKTVPLSVNINGTEVKYSPRAFGAYNAKYNIQLLSGRNASKPYSIVGIVDVATDKVIKHVYKPITGNSTRVTGHSKWLDEDHFAVVDRGNRAINIYKVFINDKGNIDAVETDSISTGSASNSAPIHGLERVKNIQNREDIYTFYGMGESISLDGKHSAPFIQKYIFNPSTGKIKKAGIAEFKDTNYRGMEGKGISPSTHHANITPDGKYIIVPVFDGMIYRIRRDTMQIVDKIDTTVDKGLGAGHIVFSDALGIAVVTNHWSPYITLIDITDDKFKLKGFLKIYKNDGHDTFDPRHKHLFQPHFAQISKDGKYFYTFASQDNGRFVKVNLEEVLKLESNTCKMFQYDNDNDDSKIIKATYTGGAPEQAHS